MKVGKLNSTIISWLLRGRKYRCNLCETTFKGLQKDVNRIRENARCPRCQSDESMRALWLYLKNEILGKKNKNRLLFFGKESVLTNKLKEASIKVEIFPLDYFNETGKETPEAIQGNCYDVIVLSQALQFVNDDQPVFSELKRLLRPGGIALVQTITNPEMDRTYENINTPDDIDRLKNYYEPGIVRIYGANFHKHLIRSGFEVEVIDYAEQLGPVAREYYRLGNGSREIIYKCKKNINQPPWK